MVDVNTCTLPERAGTGEAQVVNGVSLNRRYVLMDSWYDWYCERSKTVGASELGRFLITGKVRPECEVNDYLDSIMKFGNDYEPFVYNVVCRNYGYHSRPTSSPLSSMYQGEASQHDLSYYLVNDTVHASLDSCFNGGRLARGNAENQYGVIEIKTGGAESIDKLNTTQYKSYCAQAVVEALCAGASNAYIAYAQRPKDFATMTSEDIQAHLRDTTVLSGNLLGENGDAHAIRTHESLGGKPLADLTIDDLLTLADKYTQCRAETLAAE